MRPSIFRRLLAVFFFAFACSSLFLLLWQQGYRDPREVLEAVRMSAPKSMEDLTAFQKGRLQEVADLLLEVYETVARMRYIDPAGISKGRHNITDLLPLYKEKGLDPRIIYLYSILPYVETDIAGNADFYGGGTFIDFRDPEKLDYIVDPFYGRTADEFEGGFDDEDGPYMRPWYTPLSEEGNHMSVVIYDARRHRIWIIDSEFGCSTDPALEGVPNGPEPRNRNSLEPYPSRRAGDVLRDMKKWYLALREVPGGGEQAGLEWSDWYFDIKGLYRKYGWPDHFDGDGWEVAKVRTLEGVYAKERAEDPLGALERSKTRVETVQKQRSEQQEKFAFAKTTGEKWLAKYRLWQLEREEKNSVQRLKDAEKEADKLCPEGRCQREEDLPLWESEGLRLALANRQREVEDNRNYQNEVGEKEPETARMYQYRIRLDEKQVSVYEKAYDEAKADTERLCPGRTPDSVVGIKRLRGMSPHESLQEAESILASLQTELEETRDWAMQLPDDGAEEARKVVQEEIEHIEKRMEEKRGHKKNIEKWIAKEENASKGV